MKIDLSTVVDLVKAATAGDATDTDTTAVAELRKALGIDDVDDKIATALTKAAAAEDLEKVAGRLAKVEDTVVTSGPSRMAPQHPPEDTLKLDKAAYFRGLAGQVVDRDQAAAYRRMADELDPPKN